MNKTIKTIRRTEPDLIVNSKPLSESEKRKLSEIIAKSKQKAAGKTVIAD